MNGIKVWHAVFGQGEPRRLEIEWFRPDWGLGQQAEESFARMIYQRGEMRPIVIDRILSTNVNSAGQAVMFPRERGQVDVTIYEIGPGAVLPVHKHPFPRMGYILCGTLRVTHTETQKSSVYVKGDFALEAVDEWHEAENIGDDPIKLLVIDLVEKGAQNTVLR